MTTPHVWSSEATGAVARALENAPSLAGALADAGAFFRAGAFADAASILEQLVRARAGDAGLQALDFSAVDWNQILEVTVP